MNVWVVISFLIIVVVLVVVITRFRREHFVNFRDTFDQENQIPLRIYFTDDVTGCDAGKYRKAMSEWSGTDANDTKIMKDLHGNCSYDVQGWYMFPTEDLQPLSVTPQTVKTHGDPSKWLKVYSPTQGIIFNHPVLDNDAIQKHPTENVYTTYVKVTDINHMPNLLCNNTQPNTDIELPSGVFLVIAKDKSLRIVKDNIDMNLTLSDVMNLFQQFFLEMKHTKMEGDKQSEVVTMEPINKQQNVYIYMKDICGRLYLYNNVPVLLKFKKVIEDMKKVDVDQPHLLGSYSELHDRYNAYQTKIKGVEDKQISFEHRKGKALDKLATEMRVQYSILYQLAKTNTHTDVTFADLGVLESKEIARIEKEFEKEKINNEAEKEQYISYLKEIAQMIEHMEIVFATELGMMLMNNEYDIEITSGDTRFLSMTDLYSRDDKTNIYIRIM